jgi:hypothetical protein
MNDEGIIISNTTYTYNCPYTHSFLFPTSLEQTTVNTESKTLVPKLKGILKNHYKIIPTVSPLDPWCNGEEVDDIHKVDVLD